MAAENKNYQLILMDLQMPEVNEIDAVQQIRTFNREIPIIAFTSLDHESFIKKLAIMPEDNFNDYLSKSSCDNILYRTISKWIMDSGDNLPYLGAREKYIKVLKDKEIILADDQDINRIITSRSLKSFGLKITEAKDGKELLQLYQDSLDKSGKSKFSLIITDINMPPYNGDEAAKEIRKSEAKNNISYQDCIPIIALSGNGDKKDICHFFKCQMTDYFIKGSDAELLTKLIAHYLSYTEAL
jgi:CheY-like chemotaxis protein